MRHIRKALLTLLTISSLTGCSGNSIKEKTVQLDTGAELLTVINIMKPNASDKERVLSLLKEGINKTMIYQEGYISSSVHTSLNNNYVINYSQWRTMDDLAAASELVSSGQTPKMVEAFTKGKADYHPFKLAGQYTSTLNKKVTIDKEGKLLTIINILTPKDGTTKEELTLLLKNGVADDVLTQPGFISSTVLESMNNNTVINYSQWKDGKSLQAMVARLQSGNAPKLAKAFSLSTPDYHPFSTASSHFKK